MIINETEDRQTAEKMSKTKSIFFEKKNKIYYYLLARLIQKKEKKRKKERKHQLLKSGIKEGHNYSSYR